MGAIGLTVAFICFEIAISLGVLNFMILRLVGRLKKTIDGMHEKED